MKLATTFAVLSSVAIFGCADTDNAPVPTEDETGGAQPAPPADDNDDQASESSGEAPPDAEEGGSTGDEDERGESTDTGDEGSTDTGDEGSTGSGDNEAQVRGLISVLDLEVVNADTDWSGGVVEIDFHDRAGVEPVYGNADVPDGTCAVWVHEVEAAPELLDEGAVTIEGALSPVGECSSSGGVYRCPIASVELRAGYPLYPGEFGLATVGALGNELEFLDLVGSHVELNGYAHDENNGLFPVTYQVSAAMNVFNPAAVTDGLPADATMTAYAGVRVSPAQRDFLDAGFQPVSIRKAAGPSVGELDTELLASGENIDLGFTSARPDALELSDLRFNCEAADGGNCGNNGGTTTRMVVQGRTTDALVGDPVDLLPDPLSQYATFECRAEPGAPVVEMPLEALEAVLHSDVLTIETRVLRVTEEQHGDTLLRLGHGVVGYSYYGA